MKTTSSKLFRGVMLTAFLIVSASAWISLRPFQTRRHAEKASEERPVGTDAAPRREMLPKRLDAESVEFAPRLMRTSWNGQTDPDSVWHDQHQRANTMLMNHGLPTLGVPASMPDSPATPKPLRVGGEK